jgi:ferredoxin-NADP reductase
MSTAPETDAFVRITIKQVPDGRVSPWINRVVKPGDTIAVKPPDGRFCLRESEAELLLLGAGSGITPLISLAKSALASTLRQVTLVYANRSRDAVIFAEELAALECSHPTRFRTIHWLDDERGLITADALAQLPVLAKDADCYICGPEPFMRIAEAAVLSGGAAPDRVFLERFAVGAATEETVAAENAEVCKTIKITCRNERREGPYHPGDTILESARRLGLRPAFSCLVGTCASCMAKVIDGAAVMKTNSALTGAEVAEGYILTCQAVPASEFVNIAIES